VFGILTWLVEIFVCRLKFLNELHGPVLKTSAWVDMVNVLFLDEILLFHHVNTHAIYST